MVMMRSTIYIIVFCLLFITNLYSQSLFYNLNKSNNNPSQIIASIDTITITAEEFFYSYEFGPAFPKRQKDSKEIHLNFMINEKLLALEGYESGILNKSDVKNIYTDFHSDLATEELFKDEILNKITINDQELNVVVNNKNKELDIRWIFVTDEKRVREYVSLLTEQSIFDSLFNEQINDSVFLDQRQMKISMFNLNKKNPILANVIDTMIVGEISAPIQTQEGWYIIKFDNKTLNVVTTESERNKLWKEAREAVTMYKMDSLSDRYVYSVLFKNRPTIKRDAFNILRSYLAKYVLAKEKYSDWELDKKLESALNNLGILKNNDYPGIVLIESADTNIVLDEFLYWYRNREQYIKLRKSDFAEYSKSLENLIWQMLRDKLLTRIAEEKKYYENEWVKVQSKWWKDKIVYSALRNEYANSITLDNTEIRSIDNDDSNSEKLNSELSKKILHKVLELKKNHKISINKNLLDKINVSSEEDKKAIDFYSIKKGGLIPRPAYPTIDNEWASWL
jgi:hypothetical protein